MDVEIRTGDAVVPSDLETLERRRLLVLLHGRGADEQDLLPVAELLGGDDVVVSPRGPFPFGPGFAWAGERVLGGGEGPALGPGAEAVLRWLDGLIAVHGEPSAIRLLGFSQGGALALAMLRRASRRFERIVVLSGFSAAEDLEPELRTVPVLFAYGDADPVIPPRFFQLSADWLKEYAAATVRTYSDLGHAIDDRELEDVRDFLR